MLDITDFSGLTGIIITPGNSAYDEARQEYNKAIQKFPLAIVYCLSVRDVRNAVLWARANDIGIRIRSGRHNYEGYSVGDGVLVIDLSRLDDVAVNRSGRTVTVGGGVSNAKVYRDLAEAGLPFAGGSCPSVGVSGYAMGGGWNFFCRYWGMGCDWLQAIQMVNYEGDLITADEHRNPDLYWACRGGGDGNFGVVVSMTFRLPPLPGRVTFFTLYRPGASADTQASFLDAWQRLLPVLDNRITMRGSIYNSAEEGRTIFVRGILFGAPREAGKLLQPLIMSADMELTTQYVPFPKAVSIIGSAYPASEMFKSPGRFVYDPLDANGIHAAVRLLDMLPEGQELIELALFAMGGAVRRVPDTATAFFYRRAQYILAMQAVWTEPRFAGTGVAWVRRAFNTLRPLTAGSFVNFPYDELADYETEYFGGNVPRLRAVKREYDPLNVFRYPQSIRV